jgi:hypothetical protein
VLRILPACAIFLAATLASSVAMSQSATVMLRVEPAEIHLGGNLDAVQLAVSSQQAGQQPADVTRAASYESLAPQIVKVMATGMVRPLGNGQARIRITHGNSSAEVPVQVAGVQPKAAVSFQLDVMPILSRAGCNGGACHGAQYGQGSFKLSLFGYAPEDDHPQIVRDAQQRRISLLRPADSLLLRKPTLEVSHGGGRRFDRDSYDYEVLRRWLEADVPGPQRSEPTVTDLTVAPAERVYNVASRSAKGGPFAERKATLGDAQQLRVVARYSDGSSRDVTHRARYDSMSDAVAAVSPTGYVEAAGSGQTAIMVRYEGQAKISMAIVPFVGRISNPSYTAFKPHNFIDEHVLRRWQLLGLAPSPPASDEVFIRRAFLDSIGTLPPPERVKAFLASSDPKKREALVDELLGLTGDPRRDLYTNEWSAYWALKWADLLRVNRNTVGDGGMWAMHNWIRASLREHRPIDQFVRELITAQGSVFQSGPANYYRIARQPEDLAESTAQNFLGVRLQCAKCHHHPFEVYSQGDYYGLAAFFTRVTTKGSLDFGSQGGDSVVMIRRTGAIRHPRTGQTMQPTPLLDKPVNADEHRDLRRPLAEWLTAPGNRLFARNLANRFWGYLMGVGLVEPIDDMRATNPPSNPELLDALADHLVREKFDLRQLMRAIMTSRVYQLSSAAAKGNSGTAQFYTHYSVKRLPAEVTLDAINTATLTEEKFTGIPAGTRAIELPDPNFASYFLDVMGRPKRVITCECERTSEPNLAHVLHLVNGDVLNRKLTDPNGRAAKLAAAKLTDEQVAGELYLALLSRVPTKDEVAKVSEIIGRAPNRREGIEDLLWALCNSREFLFNH